MVIQTLPPVDSPSGARYVKIQGHYRRSVEITYIHLDLRSLPQISLLFTLREIIHLPLLIPQILLQIYLWILTRHHPK